MRSAVICWIEKRRHLSLSALGQFREYPELDESQYLGSKRVYRLNSE
jgi:hypothetical protein